MAMEELVLTDAQAQALLESPSPLEDVYRYFDKLETGYMDVIRDSIESRAGEVCREPEELNPLLVYLHSAAYASKHKPIMRFVGIRTPMIEDMEENQRIVPEFWEHTLSNNQFMQLCQMGDELPNKILGISVYQDPENIFYYIASATKQEVPVGMFEFEIPATTWVVFENDGCFKENVQSIFRRFYTEWLPFSGYEYAGFPDIEVYPVLEGKPLKGHSEVWIAIKKIKEV